MSFHNCSICEYGDAVNGGFAYVAKKGALTIDKNTRLTENRATSSGGVIFLEEDTTLEMHDVAVMANQAKGDGGAIAAEGTKVFMTNVQFVMNKARGETAKGINRKRS
jgi:predicted outer membrane repeat protein